MELYLAGVNEKDNPSGIEYNALFSYADDSRPYFDKMKDVIKPSGKLFIDSGAFTSWTKGLELNTDEYIDWLNERSDYIDLCGQVDVIPGDRVFGADINQVKEAAEKTWENYLYMRDRLKNPSSLLYTFHIGEPIEFLKTALEWTDEDGNYIPYIALGGLVGKNKSTRDKFLEKCFKLIRSSSNPDVKVHVFGMTDFELLEKYPIYSSDSTSWIMVGAMGSIMTDFGTVGVSDNQENNPEHFSNFPKEQIQKLSDTVEKNGFTLEDLSSSRDNRVIYNALYMYQKIEELNNKPRKFSYRKSLF